MIRPTVATVVLLLAACGSTATTSPLTNSKAVTTTTASTPSDVVTTATTAPVDTSRPKALFARCVAFITNATPSTPDRAGSHPECDALHDVLAKQGIPNDQTVLSRLNELLTCEKGKPGSSDSGNPEWVDSSCRSIWLDYLAAIERVLGP